VIRVSRKTDYAIRVMLALARHSPGARLPTKTIQEEIGVPRAFLQRIIANLAHARLVSTFPGPHGGVQLRSRPQDINLLHIWEAIEGPIRISECLDKSGDCVLQALGWPAALDCRRDASYPP